MYDVCKARRMYLCSFHAWIFTSKRGKSYKMACSNKINFWIKGNFCLLQLQQQLKFAEEGESGVPVALFQPVFLNYVHHINTGTPNFFELPLCLQCLWDFPSQLSARPTTSALGFERYVSQLSAAMMSWVDCLNKGNKAVTDKEGPKNFGPSYFATALGSRKKTVKKIGHRLWPFNAKVTRF